MSNPFLKRQIKLNPSGKANKTGYVMFTENGGSILPANATTPGPYPPPTVYSFILAYDANYSAFACSGTQTTTYYSTSSTLGALSKLYTNSGLTITAPNGFYSEVGSGHYYDITDSLGTINSVSACITCWHYTYTNNSAQTVEFAVPNCTGDPSNIIFIPPGESIQYCSNEFRPGADGSCI